MAQRHIFVVVRFQNANFNIAWTMVSNGTGQCNFSGQRDRSSFIVMDKGTTGQAKNLAKGRDGPGQPKFGTGHTGFFRKFSFGNSNVGINEFWCKIG